MINYLEIKAGDKLRVQTRMSDINYYETVLNITKTNIISDANGIIQKYKRIDGKAVGSNKYLISIQGVND